MAPIIGEQLVADWDIERHASRIRDGKTPALSERLEKLEKNAIYNHLSPELFADPKRIYSVDNIFAIRKEPKNEAVEINKIQKDNHSELRLLLETNPYHTSPFWKINKKEHQKRVDAVMGCLDADRLPTIYEVQMPVEKSGKALKETAEAISKLLQ